MNVEVIRLDISVIEVRVDRGRRKAGTGCRPRVTETGQPVEGQRRRERGIARCRGHQVRHRLIGQDRVTAAHRGLAVLEWIPREAYARLEVLAVLPVDQVLSRSGLPKRSCALVEYHEAIVAFGWRHKPIIAQAKLQRQARTYFVAVLCEQAQSARADAARLVPQRDGEGVDPSWPVGNRWHIGRSWVRAEEVIHVGEAE